MLSLVSVAWSRLEAEGKVATDETDLDGISFAKEREHANQEYKRRRFASALEVYFSLWLRRPTDLGLVCNMAAVCLEQNRLHECVQLCQWAERHAHSNDDLTSRVRERRARAQSLLEDARKKKAETVAYDIVPLPGRGLGLVASKRFRAGEVVVSERPLIVASRSTVAEDVMAGFRRLNNDEKEQVLGLTAGPGEEEDGGQSGNISQRILAIYKHNASNLGRDSTGLFPVMSRINHSCLPNTNFVWDEEQGRQVVIAIKDIAPGTELTDSYLPDVCLLSTAERRAWLKRSHGFDCACADACGLDPGSVGRNDEAVAEMARLREELNRSAGDVDVRHLRTVAHNGETGSLAQDSGADSPDTPHPNEVYLRRIGALHSFLEGNTHSSAHMATPILLIHVRMLLFFARLLNGIEAQDVARQVSDALATVAGESYPETVRWRRLAKGLDGVLQGDGEERLQLLRSFEPTL